MYFLCHQWWHFIWYQCLWIIIKAALSVFAFINHWLSIKVVSLSLLLAPFTVVLVVALSDLTKNSVPFPCCSLLVFGMFSKLMLIYWGKEFKTDQNIFLYLYRPAGTVVLMLLCCRWECSVVRPLQDTVHGNASDISWKTSPSVVCTKVSYQQGDSNSCFILRTS